MRKLYIIRLTKQERVELQSVVKKLKGTGQKVRRAQILLKADADGRIGLMSVLPRRFRVGLEPWNGFASGSSSKDLKKHSTELNVSNHPWISY
ncbi:MAG: hypothetical protein R3B84_14415 [Zavarzinella sp.]